MDRGDRVVTGIENSWRAYVILHAPDSRKATDGSGLEGARSGPTLVDGSASRIGLNWRRCVYVAAGAMRNSLRIDHLSIPDTVGRG